jgi:hypothetical protein
LHAAQSLQVRFVIRSAEEHRLAVVNVARRLAALLAGPVVAVEDPGADAAPLPG